ncbi:type I-E CRISPR-associated protein Cse2/CasB [Streptomyces sp. NBC_00536]|uniref:type I-E CRISPR-associated protein Cse2/CasB n=1 Tax=Streptomyces sp. NBC_00536 TaxID=2975769 RepID=UPI002E813F8D|nr:type I-E CRISPR-associated protein Cse2/CasB [Streptomyces sp. NBC_00536]WUC83432.1 type I-E CRISPR-associated protein Cse2/CasB [Streptomyces sp. NBC_00536]
MTTIESSGVARTDSAGQSKPRPSEEFVAGVLSLCARDKGAQADLRSGLALPYDRCHRLHRHLTRLVPREVGRHPDARRPYYALAALIAARSRTARQSDQDRDEVRATDTAPDVAASAPVRAWWDRPNLGAALAEAVNKGVLKPNSAESELHLMARVGSDALHTRLPALTRQLTGAGVHLDWAVLLEDLSWWDNDQDRIATRWLESYFRLRSLEDRAPDSGADELTTEVLEENQ